MLGLLLAFSTLLTWSFSDLVSKHAVRKHSTLHLLFWGQALGGTAILILGLIIGEIQSFSLGAFLWSGFLGSLNVLGMYTFYKSIEYKGVSLSLPIVYSWSVPTIALSYFFLHELPSSIQILGILAVVVGLFLVCIDRNSKRWIDGGILFAFISMFTWALFYFLLIKPSELHGEWLMSGSIKTFTGLLVLPFLLHEKTKTGIKSSKVFWTVGLIGLCDALGLLAISYALQISSPAIVTGITSTTPVLVAAAGIFFYKEKVVPSQILGIVVTVVGLILLTV